MRRWDRGTQDVQDVNGLTVGILAAQPGLHPAMEAALGRAASAFEAAGARVRYVAIDYLERLLIAAQVIYAAECLAIHRDELRHHPDRFGRNTRHRVIVGAFLDAADERRARHIADLLRRRFDEEVMASCEILLCPAAAGPAPRLDASAYGMAGRSGAQTLPFNLTGHPAVSLPFGSVDGLPLGLQLVARHFNDAGLLAAADALVATNATNAWVST